MVNDVDGQVHTLCKRDLLSLQRFARKLIHFQVNQFTKADIKREIRVMSELSAEPRCQNIVTILKYGQLKFMKGYYFIDMELGTFTLETFLAASGFGEENHNISWESFRDCNTVVVPPNCSPVERIQNWCTIGAHIATGLKYMHSHKCVHRDLKPVNGTLTWNHM
jgi:serine/threonine protein kinase